MNINEEILDDSQSTKVSFFQKSETKCPVCHENFYIEQMLSGGGRLNAGKLLSDLRREYQKSKKFGKLNPLIYSIIVCPHCYYATFPEDFKQIDEKTSEKLLKLKKTRFKYNELSFGNIDFNEKRTLLSGASSYFLAILNYSYFDKKFSPTIKKAISSIRTSWIIKDLLKNAKFKNKNFDDLYIHFRILAEKLYTKVVEYSSSGKELIDNIKKFGPDNDKDYGYDGLIYLYAYLKYDLNKLITDPTKQQEEMLKAKRALSKVFGIGKATKEKPGPLLDLSKDIYEEISKFTE